MPIMLSDNPLFWNEGHGDDVMSDTPVAYECPLCRKHRVAPFKAWNGFARAFTLAWNRSNAIGKKDITTLPCCPVCFKKARSWTEEAQWF